MLVLDILLAAQSSIAGVIIPGQIQIVHPPDLVLFSDGGVDAETSQVLEGVV